MFIGYAINQFFQDVQTKISSSNYLVFPDINKYYFYDPNLTFERRLDKRLDYFDYSDRGNPFIAAMWNRSALTTLAEQARKMQAVLTSDILGTGNLYNVKNVKCQVNVCFVSNDPEYLTTFEELFVLNYDRSVSIVTDYQIPVTFLDLGSVVSVNQTTNSFVFQGQNSNLKTGSTVVIFNSANNNGSYAVTSVIVNNGNTSVTVTQSIPSSTVDGELSLYNTTTTIPVTLYFSDIELTQLNKLDTDSRGELTFLLASMNVQYPVIQNVTLGGAGGSGSIIKQIDFDTKTVGEINNITTSSMTEPYDEIIIE